MLNRKTQQLTPNLRGAIDDCMARVMREVHAGGLVPAFIVCFLPAEGSREVLMPCGPGVSAEDIGNIMRRVSASMDEYGVQTEQPITAD